MPAHIFPGSYPQQGLEAPEQAASYSNPYFRDSPAQIAYQKKAARIPVGTRPAASSERSLVSVLRPLEQSPWLLIRIQTLYRQGSVRAVMRVPLPSHKVRG